MQRQLRRLAVFFGLVAGPEGEEPEPGRLSERLPRPLQLLAAAALLVATAIGAGVLFSALNGDALTARNVLWTGGTITALIALVVAVEHRLALRRGRRSA